MNCEEFTDNYSAITWNVSIFQIYITVCHYFNFTFINTNWKSILYITVQQ